MRYVQLTNALLSIVIDCRTPGTVGCCRVRIVCGCGHNTFFQTKLSLGVYAGLASGGVSENLLLDALLQCPFLSQTFKQVLQPLPVIVALSDAR